VSVVTAVHNAERYVRIAVESILTQTFTDFEYIIIDDGSADRTSAILREVADDPRISVVPQQHMGIARSLNKGTSLARGTYIARQDSDDLSAPDRLAKQVEFLEGHPDFAVVGSAVRWIDEEGNLLYETEFPEEDAEIRGEVLSSLCFIHGSLLIRRTALEAIGGYRPEFPISSDYDLYLRLLERFRIANLSDFLYSYRAHQKNHSRSMPELTQLYIEIARKFAQLRRETGRDLLMFGSSPTLSGVTPWRR
jgi:glycosyltransferase involved in cell wall biosynthesis